MTQNDKKLWRLADKLSNAARQLVGGRGLRCFSCPAANVFTLSQRMQALRAAVEAYDKEVRRRDYEKEACKKED